MPVKRKRRGGPAFSTTESGRRPPAAAPCPQHHGERQALTLPGLRRNGANRGKRKIQRGSHTADRQSVGRGSASQEKRVQPQTPLKHVSCSFIKWYDISSSCRQTWGYCQFFDKLLGFLYFPEERIFFISFCTLQQILPFSISTPFLHMRTEEAHELVANLESNSQSGL